MSNLEKQSIWVRKDLWPRGDLEHVFLADAFNSVGRAMFPSQWAGNEPSLVGPSGKPLEGASAGDVASVGRAVRVAEWITDQGRYGHLVTNGQSPNGGYFIWDKSMWRKEPDWKDRLRSCHSGEIGRERPLFFTRQSFERALAGVSVEETPTSGGETTFFQVPKEIADVWLSPFMQIMIDVARAAKLGPTPEEHEDTEALQVRLLQLAHERGVLEMTSSLAKAAATLIRHPDAKGGVHTWRARLDREGSDPISSKSLIT